MEGEGGEKRGRIDLYTTYHVSSRIIFSRPRLRRLDNRWIMDYSVAIIYMSTNPTVVSAVAPRTV